MSSARIFSRHFLKVELIFNHIGTRTTSLSLKIVEKVSFDIASEASYIYILSGQTVLPDRSISIGQKIVEKCQNSKIQMRHFELFSNIVYSTIPNMKEYRSALIWLAFTGRVRLHVISMLEVDVLGIRKHVACINIQSQRKLMWGLQYIMVAYLVSFITQEM